MLEQFLGVLRRIVLTLPNVRFGSETDIKTFLHRPFYVPIWFMNSKLREPQPPVTSTLPANQGPQQSTTLMGSSRHDGWTGEKMAIFLETLAPKPPSSVRS